MCFPVFFLGTFVFHTNTLCLSLSDQVLFSTLEGFFIVIYSVLLNNKLFFIYLYISCQVF